MTSSVHAEHPPPINLIKLLALGWPFTILKVLNLMGQPACSEEDLTTLKSSHLATLIALSSACRSSCQNPHDDKDKLANGTPNKGSNRCIPAPTATRAPTLAVALVVARLIAFGSADSSMIRYLEDDLQRIVRTIFEARLFPSLAPLPVPTPIVAAALHYKGPRERPLKTRFPDIY